MDCAGRRWRRRHPVRVRGDPPVKTTADDELIARNRRLEQIKTLSPWQKETALAWLSGYAPDALDRAIAFVEGLRS